MHGAKGYSPVLLRIGSGSRPRVLREQYDEAPIENRCTGGGEPASLFRDVDAMLRAVLIAANAQHQYCRQIASPGAEHLVQRFTGTRDLLKPIALLIFRRRYRGGHPVPTRYGSCRVPRPRLSLALAGLILTAPGLGVPAAAQFMIGLPFGMGMITPPVQEYAPSPSPPSHSSASSADRKSHRVRHAQRARSANERHATEARTSAPAKSDSKSSGAF